LPGKFFELLGELTLCGTIVETIEYFCSNNALKLFKILQKDAKRYALKII
jgi:hypothetical protein